MVKPEVIFLKIFSVKENIDDKLLNAKHMDGK